MLRDAVGDDIIARGADEALMNGRDMLMLLKGLMDADADADNSAEITLPILEEFTEADARDRDDLRLCMLKDAVGDDIIVGGADEALMNGANMLFVFKGLIDADADVDDSAEIRLTMLEEFIEADAEDSDDARLFMLNDAVGDDSIVAGPDEAFMNRATWR